MKNSDNEKPVLAQLRELKVGQSITCPAERGSYLRTICSQFGFEWGRRFKTTNNRELRTVTATRIA